MPIDYSLYPKNWLTEIRPAVLERAKHRCEYCGVRNYAVVRWNATEKRYIKAREADRVSTYKMAREICNTMNASDWYDDWKIIILTVAHLDQDVNNNDMSNLKALCQRCHLNHDRLDNLKRRRYGKNYWQGQQKLDF